MAAAMTLVPGDPLAHRALESLLRAEANVRRRLSADLEREGLSATGFSVLVVLTTAGGELELRALRARLRTSKANATEVVTTLEARGLVACPPMRGRAAVGALTAIGLAAPAPAAARSIRVYSEHGWVTAGDGVVVHRMDVKIDPAPDARDKRFHLLVTAPDGTTLVD